MTIANNVVAKLSVAFVAIAMMFSLVAAPAQAQTAEELQAQIESLMATINALQAQLGMSGGDASPSGVCPYTWTRTLNIGDSGADVMKLQQFLNSNPATQVAATGPGSAGNETEFYGPLTGAAVAKFQEMYRSDILSPLGLVNPTTYFGPATMAKANALCVAAPEADDAAADDAAADDAAADDAAAEEDAGPVLGDGEGDIKTLDQIAADEASLEEGTTAGLLAFEAEIEGDVEIDRIDFFMDNTAAGSQSADAADYFEGASLWVDGDKVADLDISEWDEDNYGNVNVVTGAGDEYRLRFSGLGLVFADGDTPQFQLALEAVRNIDSADETETWGIDTTSSNIRFVDGQGFTDTAGDATIQESFTFDPETVAELTVTESTNSPDAMTIEVSDTGTTDDVTVAVFKVDEDAGIDATIDDLTVTITTTGTTDESAVVRTASIWQDGTRLGSESVTNGGVVNFENLGVTVPADGSTELTVKLDFADADNYNEGDTVTVAFTSIDDATDANGNNENDMTISGTPSADTHTLRQVGVEISLVSESVTAVENADNTNSDDEGIFTVVFDVTAFGDDLYLPFGSSRTATTGDAVTWEILDDNGSVVSTGTTTPSLDVADSSIEQVSSYLVQKGNTEQFTLTVTFDPAASGSYKLRVKSINWNTTDATTTTASQDVTGQNIDTTKETIQS